MLSPGLEQILAQHCAPALLGAKSANLVSLSLEQFGDLEDQIALCNQSFPGIAFRILCSCNRRVLCLVYRPQMLENRLAEPDVHGLLVQFGYPPEADLDAMLDVLSQRLTCDTFPHEIGLFLDYPTGDVLGFIQNHGNGGKLCKYWKVYDNVEAAKERFACYDTCRSCLQRLLALGQSISTLFLTA